MDQMGEVDYAPGEPKGTSWHPHRGFETVTYMIDGTFQHQDSHGGGGVINDGATQWMTAGAGILHIETPPEELVVSGGLFHGLQLWVNLPKKDKFAAPRYQAIEGGDATLVEFGRRWRAGAHRRRRRSAAITGPGSTHTPITMAHATHPARRAAVAAVAYRTSTHWSTCCPARAPSAPQAHAIHGGQLAVFGAGDRITSPPAQSQDSNRPALEVVLLGGQPIREPVAHYGPFVMNTREELIQAIEDYQAGRLGVIPENALMPHTGV